MPTRCCSERPYRWDADVEVDGVIGPQTIGAVNQANPAALLAAIRLEAAAFYRERVASNRKLAPFERGWLNRAYA